MNTKIVKRYCLKQWVKDTISITMFYTLLLLFLYVLSIYAQK